MLLMDSGIIGFSLRLVFYVIFVLGSFSFVFIMMVRRKFVVDVRLLIILFMIVLMKFILIVIKLVIFSFCLEKMWCCICKFEEYKAIDCFLSWYYCFVFYRDVVFDEFEVGVNFFNSFDVVCFYVGDIEVNGDCDSLFVIFEYYFIDF